MVYCQSTVWRPCGVTLHAALQNKSVVCSGSRVTNSTVMKLHGSDNRGGIIVKTYTKSTCSHKYWQFLFRYTVPSVTHIETSPGDCSELWIRLSGHIRHWPVVGCQQNTFQSNQFNRLNNNSWNAATINRFTGCLSLTHSLQLYCSHRNS